MGVQIYKQGYAAECAELQDVLLRKPGAASALVRRRDRRDRGASQFCNATASLLRTPLHSLLGLSKGDWGARPRFQLPMQTKIALL